MTRIFVIENLLSSFKFKKRKMRILAASYSAFQIKGDLVLSIIVNIIINSDCLTLCPLYYASVQ